MFSIKIVESDIGMNIKTYLGTFHLAKSKIHKLLHEKKIMINQTIIDHHYNLQKNDLIKIDFNEINQKKVEPYEGPIDILYEDDQILIIYKPKFILVHTDGDTIDTCTNRVAFYTQNHDTPILPVHRLDYETSGLLIFGKNPLAQAYLSYQFEQRLVEKTYIALVEGIIKKNEGSIHKKIARDRHTDKQRISETGKDAITTYKVIKRFDDETLCQLQIIGGRKHQIRVHMSSIGHPVVGDKMYGHLKKNSNHLNLEFVKVTFIHPETKIPFEFELKK